MKANHASPSNFPDLESYIDYIIGNAGNMAASSPLAGASQTYTDGPFKNKTLDEVLAWAQQQGSKAGLRPRAALATPTTPPAAPAAQPAPAAPAGGVMSNIAAAARSMGPIGAAVGAGIDAMTGPPRPTRPQTTPGATFEGKPAAQWFQDAANRQGVANKYAAPTPPQPAPTAPVAQTATPAAVPQAQTPRPVAPAPAPTPTPPAARPPIQLAAPPPPPAPPGGAAIADTMRKNASLPRPDFMTTLPTTAPSERRKMGMPMPTRTVAGTRTMGHRPQLY